MAGEVCGCCEGEGWVKVKCCGPGATDCCCAYSGGWDGEECPACHGGRGDGYDEKEAA